MLGGVLAGVQYEFILAPSANRKRFKNYLSCESEPKTGVAKSADDLELENA